MSKRLRAHASLERGVTLFEVLIVVAILALVASGVSVAAIRLWTKAQYDTAKTNARDIRRMVPLWWARNDAGGCPAVEQLVADGIMDEDSPTKDPWGTTWRIECVDHKVTVMSNGPDRNAGKPDDIRVPPLSS